MMFRFGTGEEIGWGGGCSARLPPGGAGCAARRPPRAALHRTEFSVIFAFLSGAVGPGRHFGERFDTAGCVESFAITEGIA
jgi:hypothetical protein